MVHTPKLAAAPTIHRVALGCRRRSVWTKAAQTAIAAEPQECERQEQAEQRNGRETERLPGCKDSSVRAAVTRSLGEPGERTEQGQSKQDEGHQQ